MLQSDYYFLISLFYLCVVGNIALTHCFILSICCNINDTDNRAVGLSLSDIVLDREPANKPPKGSGARNFRPMYTVAKWPLGTEVGFIPGHIELDGGPSSPSLRRGAGLEGHRPQFPPISVQAE